MATPGRARFGETNLVNPEKYPPTLIKGRGIKDKLPPLQNGYKNRLRKLVDSASVNLFQGLIPRRLRRFLIRILGFRYPDASVGENVIYRKDEFLRQDLRGKK